MKFFRLLAFNTEFVELVQFLNHIIKNIPVNPKEIYNKCIKLIEYQKIEINQIELIVDSLFELYPSIMLNALLRRIKYLTNSNLKNESLPEIKTLTHILVVYSEIYPASFKSFFKRIQALILSKKYDLEIKTPAIQIIYNLVKEQPENYFDYMFQIFYLFEKISKSMDLNQKDTYKHQIYSSIRNLYLNQSEKFLHKFAENQESMSMYLIKLMKLKFDPLKDFILDLFLDLLKFYKITYTKGKISEGLLRFYLNFLRFITDNNLENEYFLFSIIKHLNLSTFNLDEIGEELTKTKGNLAKYYKLVIQEIEKSIKIIFNSS